MLTVSDRPMTSDASSRSTRSLRDHVITDHHPQIFLKETFSLFSIPVNIKFWGACTVYNLANKKQRETAGTDHDLKGQPLHVVSLSSSRVDHSSVPHAIDGDLGASAEPLVMHPQVYADAQVELERAE